VISFESYKFNVSSFLNDVAITPKHSVLMNLRLICGIFGSLNPRDRSRDPSDNLQHVLLTLDVLVTRETILKTPR